MSTSLLAIVLGVLGTWQIIIIVLLIVLLFGAKKIPELMRGVGSGIKEFKDAVKEEDKEKQNDKNNPSTTN